jgi:hypothetical protein
MRTCTALAALASLAGAAANSTAQELVTFTWSFTEVVANSTTPATGPLANNGVIDPGEAARIALRVSFSPPVGSPVTYTPPPGTGRGTIAGFASMSIDLLGGTGSEGMYSNITRLGAWNIGQSGTITSGGVINVLAGQSPLSPGPNPANPINNIWRVVWTPQDYSPRIANFSGAKGSGTASTGAALYIEYGGDPEDPRYITKAVPADFGSLQIPVVPSPSTLALIALAGLGIRRRRARSGDPAC